MHTNFFGQLIRQGLARCAWAGLLSAIACSALAQEVIRPDPQMAPFIPAQFDLIQDVRGDLNRDGLEDHVLVLQRKPSGDDDQGERILLIILAEPGGHWKLAKTAEHVILCRQCGGVFGDPLASIEIRNATLIINHYGGSSDRWGYATYFGYSRIDKTWQLVRYDTSSMNIHDVENTSEEHSYRPPRDFGKIAIDEFNLETFTPNEHQRKNKR